MSKQSTKIIKRSLLSLAPLSTLALGGCGLVAIGTHPLSANPFAQSAAQQPPAQQPAANPQATPQAVQPAQSTIAAKDEMSTEAEKSILAFADRLAKAEKPDPDATVDPTGRVVLASDQHVMEADQTDAPVATPAVAAPVTPTPAAPIAAAVSPTPVIAITKSDAPVAPAAPAAPVVADPPAPSSAMGSLTADSKDTGPAISAMGAMNATVAPQPQLASLAPAAPSFSEANTTSSGSEPSIDSVLDMLRRRVQARPQQLNYSLALALLESAEMRKTDDPALAVLTPYDQKLVSDLNAAVEAISAQPITPTTAISDRAAPLLAASQKWQNDGDLKLPRLSLATRVDSFGVYTPIEPRFEYGRRQTVIIYCEVANFSSKRGDDGWYQTVLSQQDTLTTDDGLLVWRPNPEDVEDRSMNQRKDFYLVKKLTLPENLAIGKYMLKMSVTDKLAKKRAEVTMPIEIIGKQ